TRPIGSARLVGIRVVVTTAALLVAWTAVIVGGSASLAAASLGDEFLAELGSFFGGLDTVDGTATAAIFVIQFAGLAALWAALHAWLVARRELATVGIATLVACWIGLLYANYQGW